MYYTVTDEIVCTYNRRICMVACIYVCMFIQIGFVAPQQNILDNIIVFLRHHIFAYCNIDIFYLGAYAWLVELLLRQYELRIL